MLEFTDADYAEDDLYDLLLEGGRSCDNNLKVFRRMMKTFVILKTNQIEKFGYHLARAK